MSSSLFQTDAEIALLNIILRTPSMVYDLHNVKEYMMSSTPNQLLFATITELVLQGLIPELNLVSSYLKANGRDVTIGGKEYLNYILSFDYKEENFREFERIIVDSYKARKTLELSVNLPEQVKNTSDINSLLGKLSSSIDSLIETSGRDGTNTLSTILKSTWDGLVERVKNPGIQGVTTGIKKLDSATAGMCEGDMWIFAGRPGMGKSFMICNLLLNQGRLGIPTLLFSLEMREEMIVERMLSMVTGITITSMRLGLLTQNQMDSLSDAIKKIKEYPIYIDSSYDITAGTVSGTIKRYTKLYGVKTVYVDYVQLLSKRSSESTHEIGEISRTLKILAKDYGITCILVSQLNRNVEMRENKRPMLADLRQSGNLEEDADNVIALYRDSEYNKQTKNPNVMELIILKQRSGPTGTIMLNFDKTTGLIKGD